MTRPHFQTGMTNAEFQVMSTPATGAFWPGNRDTQPDSFKGVLERLGDLDAVHHVGAGQDRPPTHSVHTAAIEGNSPVTPGMGLRLVRVKRSGSWQPVSPPVDYVVGPISQHPGSDMVRFSVVEAAWSPSV